MADQDTISIHTALLAVETWGGYSAGDIAWEVVCPATIRIDDPARCGVVAFSGCAARDRGVEVHIAIFDHLNERVRKSGGACHSDGDAVPIDAAEPVRGAEVITTTCSDSVVADNLDYRTTVSGDVGIHRADGRDVQVSDLDVNWSTEMSRFPIST